MRLPLRLALRHLLAGWVRNGLTVAALSIALFLFCFLISVVRSLDLAIDAAASNRLVTQSAVSLFIDLPLSYQGKIEAIDGVEGTTKFQWFGGYYKEPANFFAQFGVDHEQFFDLYEGDIELFEGPGGVVGPAARAAVIEALSADRRACVLGEGLRSRFEGTDFEVGDTFAVIPTLFQKFDGSAWDFTIVGFYRPKRSNVDTTTMYFRHDYVRESVEGGIASGPEGAGVYMVNVADGSDPERVSSAIDALFENGPQATMTTSEAAFQAIFASMLGNVPLFLGTLGGAVLFAVLFSVINTMLIAARQRRRESGILQALGFSASTSTFLLIFEGVLIALVGGGLGLLIAAGSAPAMAMALGNSIPNYVVGSATIQQGLLLALLMGLVAGVAAGLPMMRLQPTEALRSEG